jgi:hypothetical protein
MKKQCQLWCFFAEQFSSIPVAHPCWTSSDPCTESTVTCARYNRSNLRLWSGFPSCNCRFWPSGWVDTYALCKNAEDVVNSTVVYSHTTVRPLRFCRACRLAECFSSLSSVFLQGGDKRLVTQRDERVLPNDVLLYIFLLATFSF